VVEALKARLNAGRMPNLYFYRDAKGNEVDLILKESRCLLPIEIKAAMTFTPDMARGLGHFQKHHADALPGMVVYAGELTAESRQTRLVNFVDFASSLTARRVAEAIE